MVDFDAGLSMTATAFGCGCGWYCCVSSRHSCDYVRAVCEFKNICVCILNMLLWVDSGNGGGYVVNPTVPYRWRQWRWWKIAPVTLVALTKVQIDGWMAKVEAFIYSLGPTHDHKLLFASSVWHIVLCLSFRWWKRTEIFSLFVWLPQCERLDVRRANMAWYIDS